MSERTKLAAREQARKIKNGKAERGEEVILQID